MHNYFDSPCLLTDFYQLTMAQAYFDHGKAHTPAVFHVFFRKNPFNGNFAIAAGIQDALNFVSRWRFDKDALDYLASLKTQNHTPIFSKEFLNLLRNLTPAVSIHAVADGEVVFPFEPILRIEGPLYQCQLLETTLLNFINFQTLIATKAARMVHAAHKKPVMDFGLRRAQGFDGAISATKAAFIGGISATSNLWAAKKFGIAPAGTQAHSFIMSYAYQSDAFRDFSASFKDNTILVVDTYDPYSGIEDAIKAFGDLQKNGHQPLGIRIDSGDLLALSTHARAALDRAGFSQCHIIASGDLDEYAIERLEMEHAPIDIYAAGTRLCTAFDEPALGGVYKLAAIKENGYMRYTHKASLQKISLPGPQTITRQMSHYEALADFIVDPNSPPTIKPDEIMLHHLAMKNGSLQVQQSLQAARNKAQASLLCLNPKFLSLSPADFPYPVYFEKPMDTKNPPLATLTHEDRFESSSIN